MGICDLRDEACRQAGMIGGQRYPVLAVTAPKNDPREAALGNHLLTALGLRTRGRWSECKYLLFDLYSAHYRKGLCGRVRQNLPPSYANLIGGYLGPLWPESDRLRFQSCDGNRS